jgi:hypothetical protein
MKTFDEFVNEIDPTFFEEKAEKAEKCEDKGKKMPPWLKGDKGEKKDGDKKDGEKKENPFMKKKKD